MESADDRHCQTPCLLHCVPGLLGKPDWVRPSVAIAVPIIRFVYQKKERLQPRGECLRKI